eukprot:NODE_885_length_724_cov_277.855241_g876_i0.p1 GENE.NODE_885_length_724_cov_277.855241_g876_i0~~NODE_885_length_724_cov_277.855241_g876_i0.p1  ORF type:complete len:149 (-),score=26.89 NODE_885_length_724_cov_277.855241_g876_i0:241-687(-)
MGVRKAKELKDVPILEEKKKIEVSRDPFWIQWAQIAFDTCKKETEEEVYCKALKNVVDNSAMQHSKKVVRNLHKEAQDLTRVSMSHPYKTPGIIIMRKVTKWMVKNKIKSQSKIRPVFEKEFVPWLTDVGVENTNTMYAALKAKDDEL